MSNTTMLGETQLTQSPYDTVTVELAEPEGMPAVVLITWPLQPSVITPERFRDTAAAMVRLWSEAHIALARIKARRHL